MRRFRCPLISASMRPVRNRISRSTNGPCRGRGRCPCPRRESRCRPRRPPPADTSCPRSRRRRARGTRCARRSTDGAETEKAVEPPCDLQAVLDGARLKLPDDEVRACRSAPCAVHEAALRMEVAVDDPVRREGALPQPLPCLAFPSVRFPLPFRKRLGWIVSQWLANRDSAPFPALSSMFPLPVALVSSQ